MTARDIPFYSRIFLMAVAALGFLFPCVVGKENGFACHGEDVFSQEGTGNGTETIWVYSDGFSKHWLLL